MLAIQGLLLLLPVLVQVVRCFSVVSLYLLRFVEERVWFLFLKVFR
jgi:hypothetical protein